VRKLFSEYEDKQDKSKNAFIITDLGNFGKNKKDKRAAAFFGKPAE
jgi:hypothetical protein